MATNRDELLATATAYPIHHITAISYLHYLFIHGFQLWSRERVGVKCSNSELRRWLDKGSVEIKWGKGKYSNSYNVTSKKFSVPS